MPDLNYYIRSGRWDKRVLARGNPKMKIYERRRHRALLGAHSAMRVVRRDRKWQIVVLSLISGAILLGLSEIDVPPYHTELTYQDSMFGYGVGVNGVNFPNERLNIQALSPNDTIHISIPDSGHWVLDYKIYFVNDTNRAVGFGPSKLLFSGETSTGTNLTINNAEYNMTYMLEITSQANHYFFSTVTVNQKEIL